MWKRDTDSNSMTAMDMFALVALEFMVIAIILFFFIGLKHPAEQSKQQGNVIVELYWNDAYNTDVDLWVKAPHDIPVGYSNKGGRLFNLLRDDLGKNKTDVSGKNMEIATSRGILAGEYIINAHLFRLGDGKLPLPIKAVVSVKAHDDDSAQQLFSVDTKLYRECQEKTLIRFWLDSKGNLDPDSVNSVQQNLRNGRSCTDRGSP